MLPRPTPFAYDSMPDTRLHPHSVIVRKKRVRARRAFVRADWNIREEDHAEAVLMDEAQGTAAAHQRQRRTDVNQTFYDRRATNALVKLAFKVLEDADGILELPALERSALGAAPDGWCAASIRLFSARFGAS